ncbi:hypothetical protein [Fluviispira vulneris]|uniref:hypothetical protein n=1 Tax=Fluviispira vulneris TaxID=2763012 RepID=UPI00164797C8|nr:hypothetical protein [Fluviispira vulneris]
MKKSIYLISIIGMINTQNVQGNELDINYEYNENFCKNIELDNNKLEDSSLKKLWRTNMPIDLMTAGGES